MFDRPAPVAAAKASPVYERVRGAARVALGPRGLSGLRQEGSARAFLPRVPAGRPEIVFLNTAGGLTGGDRLDYAVELAAGAAAVATTQAAERAYRALAGRARVRVRLRLGPGADLAWLPQETILYDGAALDRRTEADLDPGARLVIAEMLVLGRAAMGERVGRIDLTDWREVRRSGAPVLVEPVRLTDAALARAGGAALLKGARALATVALVADDAEARLDALRAALPEGAAASAWEGRCVARILALGARELRRAVAAALAALDPRPLPKVWAMGGI
jgi:urease accessory protein